MRAANIRTGAAIILSGFLLGSPAAAAAQVLKRAIPIPDAPCRGCTVSATLERTIDGEAAPLRGRPSGLVVDSRGRIVLWVAGATGGLPMIFDSTGRYLGEIGRRGSGPGEFEAVSWVSIDPGDSIHVHGVTGAHSVFSPDLRHAYSRRSRGIDIGAFEHVLLPGRRIASLSRLSSAGQADPSPIALRDSIGQLVRHLRPNPQPWRPARRLAAASSGWPGMLWVGESGQEVEGYLLMLVDSLGRVPQAFERRAAWWTRGASVSRVMTMLPDTLRKPSTTVAALREDRHGRLLLLAFQPRADWKAVRNADAHREGNFFTVLEIVDPRRRQVIGRVRIPGMAISLLGDTRFATYFEDDDGLPYVQIWRFTVTS